MATPTPTLADSIRGILNNHVIELYYQIDGIPEDKIDFITAQIIEQISKLLDKIEEEVNRKNVSGFSGFSG